MPYLSAEERLGPEFEGRGGGKKKELCFGVCKASPGLTTEGPCLLCLQGGCASLAKGVCRCGLRACECVCVCASGTYELECIEGAGRERRGEGGLHSKKTEGGMET